VNGPLVVFRNGTQVPGVVFTLTDHIGNRDGIGAVLSLTDAKGVTRSREVQLGGGFMSFDAPQVHFGIGDSVGQRLEISWSGGSVTRLNGPFRPGFQYDITRK
ncbi:MAG: ASPIC/UnbV domain-containing protein, partial [Pseudomonadota bacterium]